MSDPIQNVLLCSGGKTSGFMLRKQLDAVPDYRSTWLTIFCNTGKERPQTLDFVHEIETRWDVPIIWLEYHRVPASSIQPGIMPTPRRNANLARAAANGETTHWFKVVNYETASRDGRPFDELLEWMTVLPNAVFFLTFRYLVVSNMTWDLFVPYTAGTVAGSVFGVKISMVIERLIGAKSDSHIK